VDGVYAVKYVARCVSWIQECHVRETSVYKLNSNYCHGQCVYQKH